MQKTDHYRTLGYGLMMVLFGLVIVVCLFAIIASIGYIFMKIPSWRCFMIGCFIVLGILCILSFVASVITALSIPAIYAGC
jgi:predicted membrane channel-forming protein YqfA (hemolysin III family)